MFAFFFFFCESFRTKDADDDGMKALFFFFPFCSHIPLLLPHPTPLSSLLLHQTATKAPTAVVPARATGASPVTRLSECPPPTHHPVVSLELCCLFFWHENHPPEIHFFFFFFFCAIKLLGFFFGFFFRWFITLCAAGGLLLRDAGWKRSSTCACLHHSGIF